MNMISWVFQNNRKIEINTNEAKKDIHEANVSFLHDCRKAAFFAAKELGWKIVSCAEDGRARRVDSITTQLLDIIDNALVEEVL